MKTIKVKQLSVEVGKCLVHSQPYLEYLLRVSVSKKTPMQTKNSTQPPLSSLARATRWSSAPDFF
jgi:hypothetical protein